MCKDRHGWLHPKQDGQRIDYEPSSNEITEAIEAQKAMRHLIQTTDFRRLTPDEQRSLSSFQFANSGWMLQPTISNRILSCLTDRSDFLSLFSQETISSGSIIYPIDNSEFEGAGWACEFDCDGPTASIAVPGQLEIKAESIRARICAAPDILQDASYNVEAWLIRKAQRAFRHVIAKAVMTGDGNGRPVGLLNPNSGIPICTVSPSTPVGQFGWQDLIATRYQLDEPFLERSAFMMNQKTLAQCLTMTDAVGRPVWSQFPSSDAGAPNNFMVGGTRVVINNYMPDWDVPGSTPILVADFEALGVVVTRRALAMQPQPAGFCTNFLFDQRLGFGVICPGAARLLRIT